MIPYTIRNNQGPFFHCSPEDPPTTSPNSLWDEFPGNEMFKNQITTRIQDFEATYYLGIGLGL